MKLAHIFAFVLVIFFSPSHATQQQDARQSEHCVATQKLEASTPQGPSGSVPQRVQLAQSSIRCGIAPIPPIGCRIGACVCDQYGSNCQWTFICN